MSIRVLFSAPKKDWEDYREPLSAALKGHGIQAELIHSLDPDAPETIDYIVYAPSSALKDFGPFTGARAVLNLWAGVEGVVKNQTLTQPLARMVDPALTRGMTEWVTGQVLRHHLGLDIDIVNPNHVWAPRVPPLAPERKVGILGMGELGTDAAIALKGLGFDVMGWARSDKPGAGVPVAVGAAGLDEVLRRSDIVVLLLPLTRDTENTLNQDRLSKMRKGAVILNPGRGPLIDDDALIAALDRGHIGQATLDVFRIEPLPKDHPYWHHPKVTVTPHIASATRPETAALVVAENIRRGEAGEPLLHLVDRAAGY